jgi:hypothetical protein
MSAVFTPLKSYQPAGEFGVGATVLVEGLEWAAVPVADLND